MFEDVLVDALAVVLFVLELVRVDAVFASNFVNQSELGIVPHLGQLPLLVPYEVVRKCFLRELIARRQLEYLCVKVLFLHGNLQLDLRHFDWLVQDLTGVFGKVNRVELGCLESNLVHVDDLCQIVVLSDRDIVDHIVHLLLDALIGLDFLCSCCVLQLGLREQLFGGSIIADNEESGVLIVLLKWFLPLSSHFNFYLSQVLVLVIPIF